MKKYSPQWWGFQQDCHEHLGSRRDVFALSEKYIEIGDLPKTEVILHFNTGFNTYVKVCLLESLISFSLRKKKEVRESTNMIWAWQPSIGMWHNVGTNCLLLGPWSVLLLCNYFIIGALICNHFHLKVNTHVNTPVMSCNYFTPRNIRHGALY